MRMLVLGAGLQGSACAYDLLQQPDVTEVRLADLHLDHLPDFLAPFSGRKLIPTPVDVRDRDAVHALVRESNAVMCALPYYFNLDVARHAAEAGVHFCDLGGNTEIVFQQKELDPLARERGITIIPDCGLAPGMVNILAEMGIRSMDSVERVRIYVGGLPQNPEPPLHYQIVYSLEGVLDYYTTLSWVLRDGMQAQVKALSERETMRFPAPVGELEAFHTAGGLSTMAFKYEGRIASMEYKTLRYPGHAHIMEAIRDLGLLELEPVDVKGVKVVPRDLFTAAAGPRLTKARGRDLVALRVTVEGMNSGHPVRRAWELIDYYDATHGISAMMRATGYSLSITGLMQARGQIGESGVFTPDEAIPGKKYVEELGKRGVVIKEVS